jgi:hypothetical protein
MKRRVIRLIRNIGISIVALLLLVVGAGVGYTWYMGQDTSTASVVPVKEPVAVTVPTAKRQLPGPDAKASASVQQLTSPVKPGEKATIYVRSNPTAVCTIVVEYNKMPSDDPSLVEKTTDEFGMVDWTWVVDTDAPKGKWPVTVTCSLDEQRSAVVKGDLLVE